MNNLSGRLRQSKEDIVHALRLLSQEASASPDTTQPDSDLTPLGSSFYDAIIALLTHTRQATTVLALSLKPPISPEGVLSQLDKLSDLIAKLVTVALALQSNRRQGSVLAGEWLSGVLDVFGALEQLFEGVTDPSQIEHVYLRKTGIVWDAIDAFLQNVSREEVQAVIKRWSQDQELIKDAWEEFKELLDNAVSETAGDDYSEGNDLDEFDDIFGDRQVLSPEERECAKKVRPILALHNILHSSIPRYIPYLSADPRTSLQPLLAASSDHVIRFDSAACLLHSPQILNDITTALQELHQSAIALVTTVVARMALIGSTGQLDPCATFLAKWRTRLDLEMEIWDQRLLSMSALGDAL